MELITSNPKGRELEPADIIQIGDLYNSELRKDSFVPIARDAVSVGMTVQQARNELMIVRVIRPIKKESLRGS
jgi:hypothetical protein